MPRRAPGWHIRPTRFHELGYSEISPGLWRIWSLEDPARPATVGPHYRTKAELLADLDRYVREYRGE